ncbi:MAG TPA: beta-ketoacyl synthase chain length factor [Parapedobacter sp.]|uniref:beta-ketoacyl synthase chain length factor n=1 Tax=Parapedobacter sp. TaxID=1958893 RepID=UPI002CD8EC0A|nr:beta-ketoacyl synthase chain length factor [Parapedobacter sp.]HWK56905.1 beta-ketoacyl synthase chain length factor [Parapedobacter sp.]
MIEPIYIHGKGGISIQPTTEPDYFFDRILPYTQNPIPACDPDYKALIPPLQLRRMNKSMRMAIFTSQLALQEANRTTVDAVITGSGLGCLRDSERFVEALLADERQALNPTPFIQSTHNMAAAAIALALKCKGYNMTYINNANSFESALLDGMVYLSEHPDDTILLGAVDELGERTTEFWNIAEYLKHDAPAIPTPLPLRAAAAPGEIAAEGATFFVASRQPGASAIGKVTAVETCLEADNPTTFVSRFLQKNGLDAPAIDAVLLGYNGDSRYDDSYRTVAQALFAETPCVGFKHVLGEFDTVIAAALALALQILNKQRIPATVQLSGPQPQELTRLLIYTQRRGKNHGVMLVER